MEDLKKTIWHSFWLKKPGSPGSIHLCLYRYDISDEMTDNVYEMVDEAEYAERVQERREEGFIVDDDGEYADDGREIFEEEEDR